MDFSELVLKRESCRKFTNEMVPKYLLEKIVEIGRLSPSACNSQPWQFYVVNGGEAAQNVHKGVTALSMNKFTENVTSYIVVAATHPSDVEKIADTIYGRDFASIDIGLAVAYMVLGASSIGLGACVLGGFSDKLICDAIGLPRRSRNLLRVVIAVGYPASDDIRPKKRKDPDEVITWVAEPAKKAARAPKGTGELVGGVQTAR